MSLPATLLPENWHWVALAITLVVIYRLLRSAPWERLREATQLNVLLGFAVGLALMWSMKAGVMPGLNFHLLGAMAACLALGPWLAILSLGLALLGVTLNGALDWQAWPINFLLMSVIPVVIAYRFQCLIERWLPAHFFVFVFVIAFFGSAFTVVASGLITSAVLIVAGAYSFSFLASDYLPYFILLGFSEAWIGGALITLLVVFKPEWVLAFDDRKYLIGK